MDPIADAMMDLYGSDAMCFEDVVRDASGGDGGTYARDGWGGAYGITFPSDPSQCILRTEPYGRGHDVTVPWTPAVSDILACDWRRLRCRTAGRRSCSRRTGSSAG